MNTMPLDDALQVVIQVIADALAERTREAIADALASRKTPEPDLTPGLLVFGLDPHGLYSPRFVATRWELSTAYVRDQIDQHDLPRVQWKGGSIRYRGADILRYEGVHEEELRPANAAPIAGASECHIQRQSQPAGRRIYNSKLPSLERPHR